MGAVTSCTSTVSNLNADNGGRAALEGGRCVAAVAPVVGKATMDGVAVVAGQRAAQTIARQIPGVSAVVKAGYGALKVEHAIQRGNSCLAVTEGIAQTVDVAGSLEMPFLGAALHEGVRLGSEVAAHSGLIPVSCVPSHSSEGELVLDATAGVRAGVRKIAAHKL